MSAKYISPDWLGYAVAPSSPWNLWALTRKVSVLTPPKCIWAFVPHRVTHGVSDSFHFAPPSLDLCRRETEGTGGIHSSSQISKDPE